MNAQSTGRTITTGLAALAAAATVAAIGAAAPVGATTGGATAAKAPTCQNSQMKATYKYDSSGAGHTYGFIVLQNTGTRSCTIGGWGGLSYVGNGDGSQIGRAAVKRGKKYLKTVAPGQRVRSPLDEKNAKLIDPRTCRPHAVDGFRVYIPYATKSQYIPHKTTGCSNSTVVVMAHGSYR